MAERIHTVVVGGSQAGLAVGYHLARADVPFLILDAEDRIGDAWRRRWDSLRLFSPARYSGLPGMGFPAGGDHYPTKTEMADYLETYANRFELPVRTGTRVDSLERNSERFVLHAGTDEIEAENVVIAMATHQVPWVPSFAARLDEGITQLHTANYLNPSQLQDGPVLVVGAGNSGAEIALDVAGQRRTMLSGTYPNHVPIDIDSRLARRVVIPLIFRVIGHHVLTVDNPLGRRVRPNVFGHGAPLIRTKPKDITAAGIENVPRVQRVRDGLPQLEDGRVTDVPNVIWCTGFRPSVSWIHLPVFEEGALEPNHRRGVVEDMPGLYFVGLMFLYSMTSGFIRGLDRDAKHVVDHIVRTPTPRSPDSRS